MKKLLLILWSYIFPTWYYNVQRKKEEHKLFIKRFPCPDCRPDLECTFYWDIPQSCSTCGRKYSI